MQGPTGHEVVDDVDVELDDVVVEEEVEEEPVCEVELEELLVKDDEVLELVESVDEEPV